MNLKRATFAAGRWTSFSTLVVTGLQVLQTMVLARILLPQDFGLMAVAGAVIAVAVLLADLGLSQALIHFDTVPRTACSSIYWLNMLLAIVLMAALWLAAPVLGRLYDSAALVSLLRWTSVMFPLAAAGQQLRALAAKDLRFDRLALADMGAATTSLACAVIAALLGAGVYALAIGLLVRTGMATLLCWIMLPATYRPDLRFHPREALPYLTFGGFSVGETLANDIRRSADIFVGGLVLGPGAVGVYAVPRDLSLKLASVLNRIVTRVGFPVMSKVKSEQDRVRHIYMQTLRMTASINFPLYVCLGLFASEIVNLLYGPQWHEAIRYLQILAAWGLIRSTGNPAGSLIYAVGRIKRAFWWNISMLVILPPLYWLATHAHGLPGLAVGVLALQALIVIPAWYFLIRPCCDASLKEYLSQFGAPLVCALGAGALAWLVAHDLPHGTLRLAAGGVVGSVAYLGFSWFLNRRWVNAMRELLWPGAVGPRR